MNVIVTTTTTTTTTTTIVTDTFNNVVGSAETFSSLKHPDQHWVLPGPLSDRYRGSCPRVKAAET